MTLGAAARHRNDGAAEALGAVMRSKPAGEQPVTVGIVDDIAGHGAGAGERTRHQVRPAVEVALGIADDGRLARRSRRGMDPDNLVARHRKHTERIIISQVRLERERKPREVGERLEVGGLHARGVKFFSVAGHVRVGVVQCLFQAGCLQPGERRARHRLDARLEHENSSFLDCRLCAHRCFCYATDHPGLIGCPAIHAP